MNRRHLIAGTLTGSYAQVWAYELVFTFTENGKAVTGATVTESVEALGKVSPSLKTSSQFL